MCAKRGRRGGIDEARELAALFGALDAESETLDAEGIARRLGCSVEHAKHLLYLLLQLRSEDETPIPLTSDDDGLDALQLSYGRGLRGRALRLSVTETEAVLAALARLGVGAQSPLVAKLQASMLSAEVSAQLVDAALQEAAGAPVGATAELCARALADGRDLRFNYTSGAGEATCGRHVRPQALRPEGGQWYLDAYDHQRRGARVFRLDRMTEVRLVDAAPVEEEPLPAADAPRVRVTFLQSWPLTLLEWPGIAFDESRTNEATLPYYGGEWLVRRLAACGAAVLVHDAKLAAAVRAYASCPERHASR